MNAVRVHNGTTFRYEQTDRPEAGPGELVLKIEAAGICAADRKIYSGDHPWELPVIYPPGHEYVGIVVELGSGTQDATGLKLGDRATAEILIPCRTCWFCHRGLYHHCDRPGVCVGAWAEYLKIPEGAILHKIPADLDPQLAALVEPLSCSIHAINLARIELADVVVVSGLGAIGMGALQAARLRTPRRLIGLDVDDRLLDLASNLGADVVLNPTRDDVGVEIRALTDGRGADIFIEVSGAVPSFHTGLEVLRKAGRLVVFGVYAKEATLDLNVISEFKELEIVGGHLSPNSYSLAIKYLAENLVDGNAMITDRYPLAEFEAAIAAKGNSDKASIKTILIP
jgi:erythritol/L-threitol dehydrogenase